MKKLSVKEEKDISHLEKQWRKCCRKMAELLLSSPKEMPLGPFSRQQRENQLREVAEDLASNEVVELLCQGFQELKEINVPEIQESIAHWLKQTEHLKLSLDVPPSIDLATLLRVEPEFLASIENYALQELAKENAIVASPLLTVVAFLQDRRPEAWFHLAFSLYQEERFELAAHIATIAHDLSPNQPEYSILLAASYLLIGENQKATNILTQAEEIILQHHLALSEEWEHLKKNVQEQL